MALQTIVSFLKKHKNTLYFVFLFFGIFAFSIHGVFADDAAAAGAGISKADSDKLIGYMNMALKACAAILGLVTSFISIFLYPGWVNGTMFGLQDYLKEIWILVSNVVYFIFAGILITIAFMNIIGKGDGTWELKQAMPKFIIGVLIVPFSWFMVQFLLSLSAILTVGILTLPYNSFQNETLFQGAMANSELADQKFCKDIVISFSGNFEEGATSVAEGDEAFQENIKCKNEDSKVSIKEIISGEGAGEGIDNGVFGIISVYTYGILRVQELDTIAKGDLTTVKGISDLIFKIIFDLLFVVVYMLLMVALFLALMVRGIRLWVFMMLSPIFGLLYFLGKTDGVGGDMGKKFSPKEFVALALVPVYVAAALAFGLTFIMVASEGIKEKSKSTDMDTLSAGGFSISIIGAHADGAEEEKSVIAKLIVELFGVVVLWIAVMAALKQSETTGAIIAPIASFGESVGKLVAAAPTYAPIIPSQLGGSVQGLGALGGSLQSGIDSHFRNSGSQSGAAFAETFTGGSTPESKLRNANEPYYKNVEEGERSAISTTLGNLKSQATVENIANQGFRKEFTKDLENLLRDKDGKTTVTNEEKNRLMSSTDPETFAQALASVLKDPNIDENRKSAIKSGLGVTTLDMNSTGIKKAFSFGDTATGNELDTMTKSEVTINLNSGTTNTTTTAGEYLDKLGGTAIFADEQALETTLLSTAEIKDNKPAIEAIKAAYKEGKESV